jgi:hypothetical protein
MIQDFIYIIIRKTKKCESTKLRSYYQRRKAKRKKNTTVVREIVNMSRHSRKLMFKARLIKKKLYEEQKKKTDIIDNENKKIAEKIQSEFDVCLGVTLALMRL